MNKFLLSVSTMVLAAVFLFTYQTANAACLDLKSKLKLTEDETYVADVAKLQDFLREQGDYTISSVSGLPLPTTGIFYTQTEIAVQKFQSRHGIVTGGDADSTGYGLVGPATRQKIKELSCGQTKTSPITTAVPDYTSKFTVGELVETNDVVKLRAGASLSGKKIVSLQPGVKGTVQNAFPAVTVNQDGYTWVHVEFDSGQTGWVADEFLKNASPDSLATTDDLNESLVLPKGTSITKKTEPRTTSVVTNKKNTQSEGIKNKRKKLEQVAKARVFQIGKKVDVSGLDELNEELRAEGNISDKTKSRSVIGSKVANKEKIMAAAKERKTKLKNLMKQDPRAFLKKSLQKAERETLAKDYGSVLESEKEVTGTLQVLHLDDFNNEENSEFVYMLETADEVYELFPTKNVEVASGSTVTVQGIALDNSIAVDTDSLDSKGLLKAFSPGTSSETSLTVVSEHSPYETVGDQRTLVLLVDFQNSRPETERPYTKEQAQEKFFHGEHAKFFEEQSYGRMRFVGDVLEWVRMPYEYFGSGCYSINGDEIENIVNSQGYSLADHDRILVLTSGIWGGCSYLGKTFVPSTGGNPLSIAFANHPTVWGSGDVLHQTEVATIAHELGHSLGLAHANALVCNVPGFNGRCAAIEYGNAYDVMGRGGQGLHFNAGFKKQLGWILSSEILNITSSGSYSLGSLETLGGYKFATIKNPGKRTYFIENRRPVGFDSIMGIDNPVQNGLLVNLSNRFGNHLRGTLVGNDHFRDDVAGIDLGPIVPAIPSSVEFQVNLTDTGPVKPMTVSCAATPKIGKVGDLFRLLVAVKGGYDTWTYKWIDGDGQDLGGIADRYISFQSEGEKRFTVYVDDFETSTASADCSLIVDNSYSPPEEELEPRYNVSVYKRGNFEGVVSTSDYSINCGPDCQTYVAQGSAITLRAVAAQGAAFDRWEQVNDWPVECDIHNSVCTFIPTRSTSYFAFFKEAPPASLIVNCAASPSSGSIGTEFTWYTNVFGGLDAKTYTWSGTDGLSGSGSGVVKSYKSIGTKLARVTVSDGQQTSVTECSVGVLGDEPTNAEPLARYPLDTVEGSVTVDVVGNRNGVVVGSPEIVLRERLNFEDNAIEFNGVDEKISLGDDSVFALIRGTLSAWVKTSAVLPGYQSIVAKSGAYGLYLSDGKFGIFDWTTASPQWISSETVVADGVWHHVACVFNDRVTDGTKCYIDGVLDFMTTTGISSQTNAVEIASSNNSQFFSGAIDEVRIYSSVLNDTDINALAGKDDVVTLSVARSGMGTGSIQSQFPLSDILCGDHCSARFIKNTTHTFTVYANQGSVFAGWIGIDATACPVPDPAAGFYSCTVVLNKNLSLTAVFNSATSIPPTVDLNVEPEVVEPGGSAVLRWYSNNATACVASGGWTGTKVTSGSFTAREIFSNTTYTLTCEGPGGSTTRSVMVDVVRGPPTVTLTASPSSVISGQSSTLTWSSTNATSCTASGAGGWSGTKETNGSQSTGAMLTSLTFTLTCTGAGGSATQSTTVTVQTTGTESLAASLVDSVSDKAGGANVFGPGSGPYTNLDWHWGMNLILASQKTVSAIEVRTISTGELWATAISGYYPVVVYKDGVKLNNAYGQTMGPFSAGSHTFDLYGQIYYTTWNAATLTVRFTDGTSLTVSIPKETTPQLPTVTLTASPTSVSSGGVSTLTWSSTNATSCTASGGWSGTKAINGSQSTGALSQNTTFTLTCTGAGGSATQSATVTVATTLAPTVTISANPSSVQSAQASTLSWSSTNADSCNASATPANSSWSGTKGVSGTQSTGALSTNTTFTLTCTGAGGTATQSTTVTVQTTGTESLAASLVDSASDKVGKHSNFGPGSGAFFTPEDWHVRADVTLSAAKTISSIEVTGTTGGYAAVWSTSNPNYYPLVVFQNGTQKNFSYGSSLGSYSADSFTLDLYAQKDYSPLQNGKVTIKFSDGSTISNTIANQIAVASAPLQYANTFEALRSLLEILEKAGILINL